MLSVQMLISDVGLLAFRDPHGIRPLVLGSRASPTLESGRDYILASESVAIDTLRFDLEQVRGGGTQGEMEEHWWWWCWW